MFCMHWNDFWISIGKYTQLETGRGGTRDDVCNNLSVYLNNLS